MNNKTVNIKNIETTKLQKVVFFVLFVLGAITTFTISTKILVVFVETNLQGKVYNTSGDYRALDFENDKQIERYKKLEDSYRKIRPINYYNNWAVDLNVETPTHARYWFKPIYSLMAFNIFFGIILATFISSLLPRDLGYFRHKIEREIISALDNIHFKRYGEYLRYEPQGIRNEFLNADKNKLYDLSSELGIHIDDLHIIKNAIIWEEATITYKFLHPIMGLNLYLRNHFTEKYSNSILSFVYIGAAFLIIIIGLRGLKFIPSSEPSLVFFALGLEFSILITYALTLMFSKPEEQSQLSDLSSGSDKLISSDKQMEKLLRAFARWNRKN